jgi:hypothetical membrane protein
MDLRRERLGVYCGIAGPSFFLIMYGVAMAFDPGYVFFRHYLSDLGVGPAAPAFNGAVIVAGGLAVPFAVWALRPALGEGTAATAGVTMTVVAGAFLVLIGVITEDHEGPHFIVTMGFFWSMLVALVFYSWTLHLSNVLGKPITFLTQAITTMDIVLVLVGFDPQTETVAVLIIVVWTLAVAITLFRRGANADTY